VKSKKGRYFLSDNFFKFWFRYVYRNMSDYEIGNYDILMKKITQDLDSLVGREFEKVAMQFFIEMNKQDVIGLCFSKIGKWWRKDIEIDLVALNENTKEILFCECKWQNKKTGIDVLEKLMQKSRSVDWNNGVRNEYFAVITRSGFSKKAEEFAEHNDFLLYTLDDIERCLG
jgi:hypothetical protein